MGKCISAWYANDFVTLVVAIPMLTFALIFSCIFEELGWTGFAAPKTQMKLSAFATSIT
jgi:membrane protease YdiL (CAAX protease family)